MAGSNAVIDLTSDSPPFRGLSTHAQVSRRAASSEPGGTGRASISPQPLWQQPTDQGGESIPVIDGSDSDDDVAVVGFNVGSPRRRETRHRRYRHAGSGRTLRVPEVTPNQRIHDGIPPGPYTRSRSSRRSARNSADIAPTRRMLLQQMELLRSSLSLDTDARYHRSRGRAAPPQLAKGFQPGWSHPLPAPPGYSHNIVEPAIDLEGFLAGQQDAVAPLPNTTPICACCERALMLDGANESRIWALPCGHVIDGLCVSRLSGRSLGARESENVQSSPKNSHAPGKVFKCPVEGCQQRCHPEPGHRHSCIELYI